jgi:hypothetical protein
MPCIAYNFKLLSTLFSTTVVFLLYRRWCGISDMDHVPRLAILKSMPQMLPLRIPLCVHKGMHFFPALFVFPKIVNTKYHEHSCTCMMLYIWYDIKQWEGLSLLFQVYPLER